MLAGPIALFNAVVAQTSSLFDLALSPDSAPKFALLGLVDPSPRFQPFGMEPSVDRTPLIILPLGRHFPEHTCLGNRGMVT
jgi:hypothetical protein